MIASASARSTTNQGGCFTAITHAPYDLEKMRRDECCPACLPELEHLTLERLEHRDSQLISRRQTANFLCPPRGDCKDKSLPRLLFDAKYIGWGRIAHQPIYVSERDFHLQ